MKIQFAKARIVRRIASTLTDLLLFAIGFILCYLFIFSPIIEHLTDYNSKQKDYYNLLVRTGLYEYNYTSQTYHMITPSVNEGETLTLEKVEQTYDGRISDYFTENNDIDYYTSLKKKSSVYKLVEGELIVDVSTSTSSLSKFYQSAIKEAINRHFVKNEEVIEINKHLKTLDTCRIYPGFILSGLIFFFVIPLTDSKDRTIGRRLVTLLMGSTKRGEEVILKDRLFRSSIETLKCVLIPLTYGAYLALELVVCIVSKDNRNIEDYISSTFLYEDDDVKYLDEKDVITLDVTKIEDKPE